MFRRFASTSSLGPTIRQLLSSPLDAQPVQLNGWVKSIRRQKRVSFVVVSDGSSPEGLQVVVPGSSLAKGVTNGAAIRLTGQLVSSPGSKQDRELQAESVQVLGECDPEVYPIQKQSLSTEYLRENVHLRARTDGIASMLRLRSHSQRAIANYFEGQGFTYTHTPIITSNDCEGAGEAFRLSPISSDQHGPREFFTHPAFLTVSSQLHLEALATSLSRVYTLSPCFRAEGSQTNRHLAEFWMLEAEWAFTNSIGDVCDVAEGAVKAALHGSKTELQALWKEGDATRKKALDEAGSLAQWPRMTYTEAIAELEQQHSRQPFEFEPKWGRALQSEHERWLAEHLIKGPVFVIDYPAELKPFYMRANDDGKTVACFDLLVPYVGELAGGSLREERYDLLESNLARYRLPKEEYGWYLDLRRFGGAPHGGYGMGFERLVGWLGGIDNVRECIAMPRWAGRMLC